MKVLVLGGGGREHALCWALARSASVGKVCCAPGNAGIAEVAETVAADPTDTALVREVALRDAVDLVVVGPEAPLDAGVADTLATAEVPVFGPHRDAAQIEASKSFAKDVMVAAGVPTARYWTGRDAEQARAALDEFAAPYVVKADGLAAGKGVRICADRAEAEEAVTELMVAGVFGDAGARIVIEEFLQGPELSVFGLSDGEDVVALAPVQDFKRVRDGDQGPNTGGMGAYSPVPAVDDALLAEITETILRPTLAELAGRAARYVGILYAGLVLTADGPMVIEFNARLGDPEAQALLPRLRGDLGALLLACASGRLAEAKEPAWDDRAAVTVVLASGGYPGEYATGHPIEGLAEAAAVDGALVFHAATRREGEQIVTAGGRVLAVTGMGVDLAAARDTAYAGADRITFDGLHRRSDIAVDPTV